MLRGILTPIAIAAVLAILSFSARALNDSTSVPFLAPTPRFAASGAGYGGIFMKSDKNDYCYFGNPMTGRCRCPNGFRAHHMWSFTSDHHYTEPGTGGGQADLYQCISKDL